MTEYKTTSDGFWALYVTNDKVNVFIKIVFLTFVHFTKLALKAVCSCQMFEKYLLMHLPGRSSGRQSSGLLGFKCYCAFIWIRLFCYSCAINFTKFLLLIVCGVFCKFLWLFYKILYSCPETWLTIKTLKHCIVQHRIHFSGGLEYWLKNIESLSDWGLWFIKHWT